MTAPTSWISRLKSGLKRSSDTLVVPLKSLFQGRRLDAQTLENLEDLLLSADLGVAFTAHILKELSHTRLGKEISEAEIRALLAQEIHKILAPLAQPLVPMVPAGASKPFVCLMVGVNGSGKTTTTGKLAHLWTQTGHKVMLVAADTFRAGAVEQLDIWSQRSGAAFKKGPPGCDSAALAFEALQASQIQGQDIVLIDTAGRLQNRKDLMAELQKIVRVLQKQDPSAPHACLLVVDATVGQNALSQVALFREVAPLSGLILTKLDGTAKGGVLLPLADKFGLPIPYIGVGEGISDLLPFDAEAFATSLVGHES